MEEAEPTRGQHRAVGSTVHGAPSPSPDSTPASHKPPSFQ